MAKPCKKQCGTCAACVSNITQKTHRFNTKKDKQQKKVGEATDQDRR